MIVQQVPVRIRAEPERIKTEEDRNQEARDAQRVGRVEIDEPQAREAALVLIAVVCHCPLT